MSDPNEKTIPPDSPLGGPGIIELDLDFNVSSVVSDAFFKESEEILANLDEHIAKLESFPHDQLLVQSLFRKIHTLKGSAGAIPGGQLFGSLAHEFEALLETLRRQKIPASAEACALFLHSSRLLKVLADNLKTQREIYPEELSEVIELISRYGTYQPSSSVRTPEVSATAGLEAPDQRRHQSDGLWITKEQMAALLQISSEFITLKNSASLSQPQLLQKLNTLSGQLQDHVDRAQKIQLQEVFSGLFPLAKQAAYELRKEVELTASGLETEVDKFLAQDLYKSLIHMIRNGLDHGIESPEERLASGKPAVGKLKIAVTEQSGFLRCDVSDDGRGLECKKLIDRALEKGLINAIQAGQLSEEQIFSFIFHPGFSTKERITTLSGRGVGMDVVQSTVQKYGGTIKVESVLGQGCMMRLRIPVPRTLLVERCMVAAWKGLVMGFPLSEVSTISTVGSLMLTDVQGRRFCQYEGQTVPLLTLEEIYQGGEMTEITEFKALSVVFVKSENSLLGLLVEKIENQLDLVIKPTNSLMKKTEGFKGTAMLGDTVTYVLDPAEMISLVKRKQT
jgi:two-component system chemotaxis sensor kinase CheA